MEEEINLFAKIIKYFERINPSEGANQKLKCLIENCNKIYCGKYHSNIIKHVRRSHADFFALNIESKKAKLSLPQKRLKFIQDSVEVVTINGRSFKHLEDSGYKKLIHEKMEELVVTGHGDDLVGPHFVAIKKQIAYLAKEVQSKIKEDVKDRFVSLMIDFATKHRRSIMGVSLQYVDKGKIVIRSIGMVRMYSSCTSAHTLDVLVDLLNSFGIEKSRVVSVTTDNAPNLSLMVKMLNETVERENENHEECEKDTDQPPEFLSENSEAKDTSEEINFVDIEDEISNALDSWQSDNSDSDEELNEILNDDDDFFSLIQALKNEFASNTLTVNGVKCAAHTLQLAINDALKDKRLDVNKMIKLCRLVCKTLRKMSYQYILEENGIGTKSPRMDCITRWSSTYYMVRI